MREARIGDRYLLCSDGLSAVVQFRDRARDAVRRTPSHQDLRDAGAAGASRGCAGQRHLHRGRRGRRRRPATATVPEVVGAGVHAAADPSTRRPRPPNGAAELTAPPSSNGQVSTTRSLHGPPPASPEVRRRPHRPAGHPGRWRVRRLPWSQVQFFVVLRPVGGHLSGACRRTLPVGLSNIDQVAMTSPVDACRRTYPRRTAPGSTGRRRTRHRPGWPGRAMRATTNSGRRGRRAREGSSSSTTWPFEDGGAVSRGPFAAEVGGVERVCRRGTPPRRLRNGGRRRPPAVDTSATMQVTLSGAPPRSASCPAVSQVFGGIGVGGQRLAHGLETDHRGEAVGSRARYRSPIRASRIESPARRPRRRR